MSRSPIIPEYQWQQSERDRGIFLAVVFCLAVGSLALSTACKPATEGHSSNDGELAGSLHLDTFVLNLSDPGGRSYLRVGIDLGLSRPLDKREAAPLGSVRDTIIGVLGQAKAEDLVTAAGKAKLKQDLLHALQERLPGLGVVEVYFTEFLIQR